MHDNWYKNTIQKIIHECWNVTIPALHRVKNKKNYFSGYITEV